jgi:hypothetical protein
MRPKAERPPVREVLIVGLVYVALSAIGFWLLLDDAGLVASPFLIGAHAFVLIWNRRVKRTYST